MFVSKSVRIVEVRARESSTLPHAFTSFLLFYYLGISISASAMGSESPELLASLCDAIKQSMKGGLSADRKPHDLAMSSSCLTQLPSADQDDLAYALDIGGTNIRLVRVQFKKAQASNIMYSSSVISQELAQGTGEALFHHLAELVKESITLFKDEVRCQEKRKHRRTHVSCISHKHANRHFLFFYMCSQMCKHIQSGTVSFAFKHHHTTDAHVGQGSFTCMHRTHSSSHSCAMMTQDIEVPLGFAFSFPCEHRSIDSAILRFWTKEFTASGTHLVCRLIYTWAPGSHLVCMLIFGIRLASCERKKAFGNSITVTYSRAHSEISDGRTWKLGTDVVVRRRGGSGCGCSAANGFAKAGRTCQSGRVFE